VIVPTYNRPESALRTLNSLTRQTLPPDCYEVIVVDDGSTADTSALQSLSFPFRFQLLRKPNAGVTIARNFGAQRAGGAVLVFIDDDVTISPGALAALAALAAACLDEEKVVGMGQLISRSNGEPGLFTQDALAVANEGVTAHDDNRPLHFSHCNTQLLAVKRDDFFALGMLQDPTGGWPNWDDVDFGYRAHRAGFRLLEVGAAVGEHWDYSLAELGAACRRWQRAGQSAVRLFRVHPDLQPHIPMFHDKTPINWRQDGLRLIGRKCFRALAATPAALLGMEGAVRIIERTIRSRKLLHPLYRWIQGGYMYRGYREGLHEFA